MVSIIPWPGARQKLSLKVETASLARKRAKPLAFAIQTRNDLPDTAEARYEESIMMTERNFSFGLRLRVLLRCLRGACPRCSHRPIAGIFFFKEACPECGLVLDRKNG